MQFRQLNITVYTDTIESNKKAKKYKRLCVCACDCHGEPCLPVSIGVKVPGMKWITAFCLLMMSLSASNRSKCYQMELWMEEL